MMAGLLSYRHPEFVSGSLFSGKNEVLKPALWVGFLLPGGCHSDIPSVEKEVKDEKGGLF